MQWAEPAVIDMLGASWDSTEGYCLVESAKRYEQYERSMAAQVGFWSSFKAYVVRQTNF